MVDEDDPQLKNPPDSSADAIPTNTAIAPKGAPAEVVKPSRDDRSGPVSMKAIEEVRAFEQFFTTGPGQLHALAQLPNDVQLKQIENDAKRDEMMFKLEHKRLDMMHDDRIAERKFESSSHDAKCKDDRRTEGFHFAYLLFVTVIIAGLAAIMLAKNMTKEVSYLMTGGVSLGAGWLGGRSTGYTKARREYLRDMAGKSDDS